MNATPTRRFQSTPVIADGRTVSAAPSSVLAARFQSTPVIADGRTKISRATLYREMKFQSTPVIADGRTFKTIIKEVDRVVVSIHARHR